MFPLVLLLLSGPFSPPTLVQEEPAPSSFLDPVAGEMAAARKAYAEGALGEAHDLLRRALEQAPDEPGVRLWLGRVLNDLGHGAEALDVLQPAVDALPRSAWLQLERGRALLLLTRAEEAERAFRSALETYPALGAARLALVEILVSAGRERAKEALELLAPLLEARPGPSDVILRHAEILALLGREEEAEACLRDGVEHAPVRLALGRRLAERGRAREAWEVCRPLVGEAHDPEERTLLAQIACRAGEPLVGLELLATVLLENPTHQTALAEIVELLEDAPDLAAEVMSRQVASHPEDVAAWTELLEGELRNGRLDAFFARAEEIPADIRSDPALALLRGEALRRADRGAEARAVLEPLCAAGNARASYEVGLLEYADGRWEEAAARFGRAATGAWAADAHYDRGICLDRLGRYAEAAEAYGAATAAGAGFPEAWLQLGHDYRLRLGEPDRARQAYRRYLALGGDDAEVRRFVGDG